MDNQSDCVRARLEEVEENVEVSPPASAKWQEAMAALEARVLRAENERNHEGFMERIGCREQSRRVICTM